MNVIQIDASVKSRLERELHRVNRFIETLRGGKRSQEMESGGDNTPLSEMADASQSVEEREIAGQLLTWLTDKSVALERALGRIEEGTYGLCAGCEQPIHDERLRALPEVSLCLECQKESEREAHPRPAGAFGWIEATRRYREDAENG